MRKGKENKDMIFSSSLSLFLFIINGSPFVCDLSSETRKKIQSQQKSATIRGLCGGNHFRHPIPMKKKKRILNFFKELCGPI